MKAKPTRRETALAAAALLALGGGLAAAPAHAGLQRLNDAQLSQVQGRSPISARQLYDNFVTPIALLSAQTQQPSLLPGSPQPPLQELQFDASQWLSAFGLHYDGPSMGTFTLRDVDTSGLRISLQPR